MSNFKELNGNMDIVTQALLTNENLCKLLMYNTSDALDKPTLADYSQLMFTKIFPYPKNTKLMHESISFLTVGFDNFKPINGNKFLSCGLFFRVLCHESVWNLTEGLGTKLRPFSIMEEISTLFNNQRIMGACNLTFSGGGQIEDGEYTGFELAYKITEFS